MLINKLDIDNKEDWVDLADIGIILSSKKIPATPNIEISESGSISKRRIFISNNYTHRDIELELTLVGSNREEVNGKIADITNLLRDKSSIIFKDNPNLVYRNIHLNSRIEIDKITNLIYELSIKLTAYDPFRYNIDKSSVEVEDLTTTNELTIVNEGNYISKPVITLTGRADKINIKVNNKTLTYVNLQAGNNIVIDNDKYSVLDIKPNGSTNALVNWRDNFIELNPGDNIVNITGEGMRVNIKIEFRDTYL